MKWRIGAMALAALLIPTLLLLALMGSADGSRWLLKQALPGQASIASIEGRLLDKLSLGGLVFQSAETQLSIGQIKLEWQAADLFSGRLHVLDLSVDDVQLASKPSQAASPAPAFDPEQAFYLPLDIALDHIAVHRAQLNLEPQSHHIDTLELSAASTNGQLKLQQLALTTPEAAVSLQGQLGLGNGFPIQLQSAWQIRPAGQGLWQGATAVTGDLRHLTIQQQLNTPFVLAVKADIANPTRQAKLDVQGHWQNLNWPLQGQPPQIASPQGQFSVTGPLDNYHIGIDAPLQQAYLPDAKLHVSSDGSLMGLDIRELSVQSKTGSLQIAGTVSWQSAPTFALTAHAQNFNPALFVTELPGHLNLDTQLQGQLGDHPQAQLDIQQLDGQLRGHPVNAAGSLQWQQAQWVIKKLHIDAGGNRLAVHGQLDPQQAQLQVEMHLPDLAALWPGLSGSLQGGGQWRGAWAQPTVQFSLQGKALDYFGQHLAQLSCQIDYSANPQKTSVFKLSATGLAAGAVAVSSFQLDGKGSHAQHHFSGALRSNQGDLSTELDGKLLNQQWQGEFRQLTVSNKDLGAWQLADGWPVQVRQQPNGWEITAGKACLAQQAAALCGQGRYLANQDFDLAFSANHLPVALLKPWLPADWRSDATLAGEVTAQQQKGLLNGRYQMALSAATLAIAQNHLALQASSLAGTLKGQTLAGEFNIGLAGQDHLQGGLQASLSKSQTLSGHLSVDVQELAAYQPLAPSLAQLKGRVQGAFSLAGTVGKPLLDGRLDLSNAQLATQQLTVDAIELHAVANGNHLQVQGSALPSRWQSPGNGPLQLHSPIHFNVDAETKQTALFSQFQLNTTEPPSITWQNQTVTLGELSASGTLEGKKLALQWQAGLLGQDYCRGHLQLDTANKGALQGDIAARIDQPGLFSVFVPQLTALKGQISANLAFSGQVAEPKLDGAINIKNASTELPNLGITVHDINLGIYPASLQPSHWLIQGSAKSGDGKLKLEGFADFLTEPKGLVDLLLTGEQFEVAKLPEAQITLSPALTLKAIGTQTQINGTLTVPKAKLGMKDIPANAVKTSPDEVILGEAAPTAAPAPTATTDANVRVVLGKDVGFTGLGLTTHLQGTLNIRNQSGKLAMIGDVDMVKASYKRFGQDLTVRKGRFSFNGPVDNPWLDLEAARLSKSKKITAVLALSGPLKQPKSKIFSEPSLPETDALAYLVTGGPLGQVNQSNSNAVASAALSYGAGQASWLTNKLGVDELGVEEGETLQDSLLAVGQYLTPDFYIGAKVGLFNKQAVLVLKHTLRQSLNVETQTGTSQRIKLNYEFDKD